MDNGYVLFFLLLSFDYFLLCSVENKISYGSWHERFNLILTPLNDLQYDFDF